jgi:hypothetical protein
MKKIIITLLLGIFTKILFAQPGVPGHPPGSYTTNAELNKFVGTWIWTSNTDTIKFVFQKQRIHFPAPWFYDDDALVGWHKYVKNGVLIESDLQKIGTIYTGLNTQASMFGSTQKPTNIYFTTFRDLTLNKRCDAYFTLLPNSTTQAKWIVKDPRGIYRGPQGTISMYTLPSNIVFTKQ